jgi:hypothetical protein
MNSTAEMEDRRVSCIKTRKDQVKKFSKLKHQRINSLKKISIPHKEASHDKLKSYIGAHWEFILQFGRIFDKYTFHANPFDLSESDSFSKEFEIFVSKATQILQLFNMQFENINDILTNYVQNLVILDQQTFEYTCQHFLHKQMRVIETIFFSEQYLSETQLDAKFVGNILNWNRMDMFYSYVFWKFHEFEDQPPPKIDFLHYAIISSFKRMKQFLYSINGVIVNNHNLFANLFSSLENLQHYIIRTYNLLAIKIEQNFRLSYKEHMLFSSIKNMARDFLHGDFFNRSPFRTLNPKATGGGFFCKISNFHERMKFLERGMEASLGKNIEKAPSHLSKLTVCLSLPNSEKSQKFHKEIIDILGPNDDDFKSKYSSSGSSSSSPTSSSCTDPVKKDLSGEFNLERNNNDLMKTNVFYKNPNLYDEGEDIDLYKLFTQTRFYKDNFLDYAPLTAANLKKQSDNRLNYSHITRSSSKFERDDIIKESSLMKMLRNSPNDPYRTDVPFLIDAEDENEVQKELKKYHVTNSLDKIFGKTENILNEFKHIFYTNIEPLKVPLYEKVNPRLIEIADQDLTFQYWADDPCELAERSKILKRKMQIFEEEEKERLKEERTPSKMNASLIGSRNLKFSFGRSERPQLQRGSTMMIKSESKRIPLKKQLSINYIRSDSPIINTQSDSSFIDLIRPRKISSDLDSANLQPKNFFPSRSIANPSN